jgi:hypothetical protein
LWTVKTAELPPTHLCPRIQQVVVAICGRDWDVAAGKQATLPLWQKTKATTYSPLVLSAYAESVKLEKLKNSYSPGAKGAFMQKGSILKSKRKNGLDVWEFRWRDRASGQSIYRRIVLGTTQQLATEAEAHKAAACIVLEVDAGDPRTKTQTTTLGEITDHYRHRELALDNLWKRTQPKPGTRTTCGAGLCRNGEDARWTT